MYARSSNNNAVTIKMKTIWTDLRHFLLQFWVMLLLLNPSSICVSDNYVYNDHANINHYTLSTGELGARSQAEEDEEVARKPVNSMCPFAIKLFTIVYAVNPLSVRQWVALQTNVMKWM